MNGGAKEGREWLFGIDEVEVVRWADEDGRLVEFGVSVAATVRFP